MDEKSKAWLRIVHPDPRAALRLFCFPWAGGGSSAFNPWSVTLSDLAEVCAVQLPGREDRLRESPYTHLKSAAEDLTSLLECYVDRPFAMFGHSVGALLAFEVAALLHRRGCVRPIRLFVSGSDAPDGNSRSRKRSQLPDAEFLEEIRLLNGTSEQVLADPDLMSLFMPSLRADFQMAETYHCTLREPLDIPITAFGGTSDAEVREEALRSWARHTSSSFKMHTIEGGHFFVVSGRTQLLRALREDLTSP